MKRKADIRAAAMARIEQMVKKPDAELAKAVRELVEETRAALEAFKAEQAALDAARVAQKGK